MINMAKKNKNGKRVYQVSRHNLTKDFDTKINGLWELHHIFDVLLCDAEEIVNKLEAGNNRKKLQLEFEEVYEKLEQLFSDGLELTEDFENCIDNFVVVK